MRRLIVLVMCALGLCRSEASAQVSPLLLDSVPQAAGTQNTIFLSLSDAIDRALRYNLGTIVGQAETRVARSEKIRALADLLPEVTAEIKETAQQANLAAFGFRGFADVPQVVGPFPVFDARVRVSQPIIDRHFVHEWRRESAELTASTFAEKDIRELVVLTATDLYLDALAGASRVETARVQLQTAQAVQERALNLKDAGVVPGIDVIRAQVELQTQQQRLLFQENEFAKEKLGLARAIGLPLSQPFELSDSLIPLAQDLPPLPETLEAALGIRPDYQRALALVHAAEESLKAAVSLKLPTLAFNADYGDIGRTPSDSHGTFTAQATLSIPLFQGGRTKGETEEARAVLDRRKAEAESLRSKIEYELRTSYLNIESARQRVRVSEDSVQLADQQLVQAQDRFGAGVANGLEVVQSQQAVAVSREDYISSLYALAVARGSMAHAVGNAETMIRRFFGGF